MKMSLNGEISKCCVDNRFQWQILSFRKCFNFDSHPAPPSPPPSTLPPKCSHPGAATCLQVQVPVGPDDPGRVVAQGHKHRLGQSFVPVALPLDGHFSARKGSVRLLFNLPKKGTCGNENSIQGPMNTENSYPLNSLLGAAGKRSLQHAPFAATPTGEGQC